MVRAAGLLAMLDGFGRSENRSQISNRFLVKKFGKLNTIRRLKNGQRCKAFRRGIVEKRLTGRLADFVLMDFFVGTRSDNGPNRRTVFF